MSTKPGQLQWHPRYLDFAAHYGFVPKACWPNRPQTKGKVENSMGYVRGNFWPGITFLDLADLNGQARLWADTVANAKVHSTTRKVPREHLVQEELLPLPRRDYDTSYLAQRQVQRDCLVHYRGSRYSVPHRYAGVGVLVREPLDGRQLRIYRRGELIAQHLLSPQSEVCVVDPQHYVGLPLKRPWIHLAAEDVGKRLPAGPGVGLARHAPVVEQRPLSAYEYLAEGGR